MLFQNPKRDVIRKPRLQQENRPFPQAGIVLTDASVSGSVLTLTFNQSVTLQGTPSITTDVAGAVPVSAAQPSPVTIEVTFDNSIAAATSLNLMYQDPAIRTERGGFVFSPVFPLAA